jgi:hypothetical protein
MLPTLASRVASHQGELPIPSEVHDFVCPPVRDRLSSPVRVAQTSRWGDASEAGSVVG